MIPIYSPSKRRLLSCFAGYLLITTLPLSTRLIYRTPRSFCPPPLFSPGGMFHIETTSLSPSSSPPCPHALYLSFTWNHSERRTAVISLCLLVFRGVFGCFRLLPALDLVIIPAKGQLSLYDTTNRVGISPARSMLSSGEQYQAVMKFCCHRAYFLGVG